MRTLTFFITAWLLATTTFAQVNSADEPVDRQIIVRFKQGVVNLPSNADRTPISRASLPTQAEALLTQAGANEIAKAWPSFQKRDTLQVLEGGRIFRLPDYSEVYILTLPSDVNRDTLVSQLQRLPNVVNVEKALRPEHRGITPRDKYFNRQWGLKNTGQAGGTTGADIKASDAWGITKGSSSIKIGIVDEGVETTHEDLSGKSSGDRPAVPQLDHGTHVAGIAAAKTDNVNASGQGIGIAGIGWNSSIYSADYGSTQIDAAQAINEAVAAGSKIINNSWGVAGQSNELTAALRAAYQAGVLLVHANPYATGNSNATSSYPNNVGPWILNVGAITNTGGGAAYTASRSFTDVGAPGGVDDSQEDQILSTVPYNHTYPGGPYRYYWGTSMAAPHVAGTASLMLAANANLRNYDIEHILKRTAKNYPSFSQTTGYGMINAYAALQRVKAPYTVAHGTATFTRIANNVNIWFSSEPLPGRGAGAYRCDVWEMKATASHQYQETPWAWLSPTAKGYSNNSPNNAQPYLYESVSPTSMTLRTYFYFVEADLDYGVTINQWAPFDPTAFRRSNGTYEYTVVGKPGTSPPSSPPSAPTGFNVTGNTGQNPRLAWSAVSGATGYKIYRCMSTSTSCTNFSYLTSTSSTTYTDLNRRVGSSCSSASGEQFTFYYVKAYNSGGDSPASATKSTCTSNNKQEAADLVAAAQELLPTAYALEPNYPNPFNPTTEIRFALPEAADVRLIVYDALGREVERLVDGPVSAGHQHATFEAANLPSGLYLYRMEATGGKEAFTKTGQMVLVK